MKTIFLHAGAHKTGSSSIQTNLAENAKLLSTAGIFYPTGWDEDFTFLHEGFKSSGNANPLAYAMHGDPSGTAPETQRTFDSLFSRIENNDCVILSHEDLVASSECFLYHFKTACDVAGWTLEPVIFIRDQMSWHISNFGQHVRQLRYSGDLEPLVTRSLEHPDWYQKIRRFENVFGSNNIKVKLFDKRIASRGILKMFFSAIDIKIANLKLLSEKKVNFGSDVSDYVLLSYIFRQTIDSLQLRRLEEYVVGNSKTNFRIQMPRTTAHIIQQYYNDGNHSIAERYFNETDQKRFHRSMQAFDEVDDLTGLALQRMMEIFCHWIEDAEKPIP
ncbi:hypothetical protein [Sphingobium subterraneum]|uniref:Uncharacterized protein n=1 Tax=Sphingobium subterraneum TaxID=627688 RepID=A0A841IYR1_9SPHN|nr:hypothetical protein [Sphingobium subterraneum]MBB6123737.1 hypothetical protein [Sphingobium subterraneum]